MLLQLFVCWFSLFNRMVSQFPATVKTISNCLIKTVDLKPCHFHILLLLFLAIPLYDNVAFLNSDALCISIALLN